MPRKTKIGTEIAHVTRDSDTTFKVKDQLSGGGGIRWRPPTQLVITIIYIFTFICSQKERTLKYVHTHTHIFTNGMKWALNI